jgi:hypothetical protein
MWWNQKRFTVEKLLHLGLDAAELQTNSKDTDQNVENFVIIAE